MEPRETHYAASAPIPRHEFSTAPFRQHEQFDAWCDFTATMCDLRSVAPLKSGFLASSQSYQLGSMLLTNFQLSPMSFTYTREIIRKSSFDHWCISALTKGAVTAEGDSGSFKAAAGGTVLHSYALPFSGTMEVTDYSGIFLSRDEFWDIADDLDRASHQKIEGPMSHIVADFIVSLRNRADHLTVADAKAVSDAFGHLARAMARGTPATMEAARAPIAATQFERARRFIMENLKSPSLSAETVCASIGVSRRQLYHLFERQGGVATYIRHRRLAACHAALSRRPARKLISSIAYEHGFTNVASFSRQFLERYGCNPSEAGAAGTGGTAATAEHRTFVDWLLRTDHP